MDGILSQDEINALLSGMDLSGGGGSDPEPMAEPAATSIDESLLTPVERDAVGEIANISMGSSATTLYSLVNRKVNITTPVVTLANWGTVIDDYQRPCVFIQIRYTAGLDGSNIMVLKEQDVKIITDLMMGGDGSNIDGELGELHLSAISEAMNQMMGSAATSMSTMLGKMIDISPPEASLIDLTEFKHGGEIASFLEGTFVKIAFRMQIDDLVDSTIMQLYPVDFARSLYETFISQQMPEPEPEPEPEPVMAAQVKLNEDVLAHVTAVRAEYQAKWVERGFMGEEPQKTLQELGWTVTLEELLPSRTALVEPPSPFTLTVVEGGPAEQYSNCNWISVRREDTVHGVYQVRVCQARTRGVTSNG